LPVFSQSIWSDGAAGHNRSSYFGVSHGVQARTRMASPGRTGKKYRAGKAKREQGQVEVICSSDRRCRMNAVKTAGHPATFAEICEAPKTVAKWKGKTVEDAVRKLVETGRLASEEIPNPKTGKGQKKTRLAYRIP
jgi:hypothetical protein